MSGQKIWMTIFHTGRFLSSSLYHSSYYFIRWCGFAFVVLDAFDSAFKRIGCIFHAHWCLFTWSPRSDILSVNTNSKGKFMICFTCLEQFATKSIVGSLFFSWSGSTEERIWSGKFAVAMDYLEYGVRVFFLVESEKTIVRTHSN